MKICRIGAKNFRTLEDFELDFSANYCAISGKNNAGKSAIVKIIQFFLDDRENERYLPENNYRISFPRDSTQWCEAEFIEVSIEVAIYRHDDAEVFFVVQTFSGQTIPNDEMRVSLTQRFTKDGASSLDCSVAGSPVDGQKASEILKKFRSTANLVVHNSTRPSRNYYYFADSYMEIIEAYFSSEDRQKIADAEKALQARVKKAARQHKDELEKILGKLNEKYQVELSTLERGRSLRFPLEIKLTDKSVEVPLNDWGSGTQNRTRALMSVLEAARLRQSASDQDRSTPVFVVEEPESFLHPSAQAEFGQVLCSLANELEIQIIATTHSPYMLNQEDSDANYLLEREVIRKSPRKTVLRATTGKDWMLPFSENLGIIPREFESWKSLFDVTAGRVVLVEGELDREYFSFLKDTYPSIYQLPADVEIVAYGGSSALKNTQILQFMIKKFGRIFITFDLDAESEVKSGLERIGLLDSKDFLAIGIKAPGYDNIEGLLPEQVRQTVYSSNIAAVTAFGSADTSARNRARAEIKRKLLEEFKRSPPDARDLTQFKALLSIIGKAFR